jgi:hypothetical protein
VGEALYAFPGTRFAALARASFHPLSNSFTLIPITVGGGYAF